MHARKLIAVAVLVILASSTHFLTAQTLPYAGGVAININSGVSGPQSLLPYGTAAVPSLAWAGEPNTGFYAQAAVPGAIQMSLLGTQMWVFRSTGITSLASNTGNINFGTSSDVGIGRVSAGILDINNGTVGSGGSLKIATVTIFNASGTLTNRPAQFNDLNLFLTGAGQQVWCTNCTVASAVDQTCVSGGGGSIAVRDGAGLFKCIS